ncbi:nitroreductase family protein [Rhizoclosmatium globosum]|uniref:Nitroreductase family protein n=1 Tax=Rhizoclosmatium globosum TaxID=329046 RepID=A0A1Y2CVS9_9FUNG|nr:nitroreductase family protein [Rhizoclosmatium globosum]|eukprot:ORY51131.1 nitroreductase family protein [Rhizoclosmatium globosum]
MSTPFRNAVLVRRSHRATTNKSPLSDAELEDLIKFAVNHSPSSFNSQTSRVVLLLKEESVKFWEHGKETAQKKLDGDHLAGKLNQFSGFQKAYGTVLIYEDMSIIPGFQAKFPAMKDLLPEWQLHGSGILQFVIWTALAEAGLGASLQHAQAYTEADAAVNYSIPSTWKLVGQLPFGAVPEGTVLPEKSFAPIDDRVKVFGK